MEVMVPVLVKLPVFLPGYCSRDELKDERLLEGNAIRSGFGVLSIFSEGALWQAPLAPSSQ